MMKRILFAGMILLCSWMTTRAQGPGVKIAEDLWGNKVPFGSIIRSSKTTVIQPFSTSNCGYCLFDGWFTAKNYLETNMRKGGLSFTQCLFNPQLDIYAFTKHYQDSQVPVLTWPPELHRYHRDGFPVILAFRHGEQVVKLPEGSLYPYDSSFETLKMTLWNDPSVHFQPVSNLQFATRIIYENAHHQATCVIADGNVKGFEANREFADRASCYLVKYFSALTASDLHKNMYLEGPFPREAARLFADSDGPFILENDSVLKLGNYRFGLDSTGISACFPNPLNREKYTVLKIRGKMVDKGFFDNSVDYTIYSYDRTSKSTRILLQGLFEKLPGNHWRFSDSLCISHLKPMANCVGVCRAPVRKVLTEHPVTIEIPRYKKSAIGEEYTFGNGSCRFPSITSDSLGTAWVCWEEDGDILLSSVDRRHPVRIAVEHDRSDSYNPLLTFSNGKLWICYLNNRDGFYRVYGRSFDGSALSEPILFSEILPCDAVSPAVTPVRNGFMLAWTCWKANFRFPYYRFIRNGIPDSVHPVEIARSHDLSGYVNCWGFSLDTDTSGTVWGAWNQHYPATLGVCSGNLHDVAQPVTRLNEKMEDSETGGYPCAVHDQKGERWVFWESSGWDAADGEPQRIRYAVFEPGSGKWLPSSTLPGDDKTVLNQTPQAVVTAKGEVFVVWSGRSARGDWSLYLTRKDQHPGEKPVKLTPGNEPARAPKIITGKGNDLWVACHYGKGSKMKIKVFRMPMEE